MSVHPTTHSKITRGLALAGAAFATLAIAPTASAGETVLPGNPSCADIGSGYTEVKIEPVRQGETAFEGDGLTGSIQVDGLYFDWTTSTAITTIIVKGGDNATVYRFDPATSGSGLHAPVNAETGRPYALSHITFCAGGPPPCTPDGAGTMADGSPCEATRNDEPQQEVLDESETGGRSERRRRPVAGTARIKAPSRCITRAAKVTVRGRAIRKVVFAVDGRKVAVVRGRRKAYTTRISTADVARVSARVSFTRASRTRARTLRTTLLACANPASAVEPHFTG